MDKLTYRKMKLLDIMLSNCKECPLHSNGKLLPYWTNSYNGYFIIAESPGKTEISTKESFSGLTGDILWPIMNKIGIKKEECFVINSVQCLVMNGNKLGKPSDLHKEKCNQWIRKYFKVLKPKKILLFGNHALKTMLNEWGIMKLNGCMTKENIYGNNVNVCRSVHPSMGLYKPENRKLLEHSIRIYYES